MNRSQTPFGWLGRVFLSTEDERVYAVVRMGFGLMALINLMLIWPLRAVWLSSEGMISVEAAMERNEMGTVLFFHGFQTPVEITVLMVVAAVFMLMLVAGVLPRLAAAVVFLWHLSFGERAPLALAGWDMALQAFSFLVLVSPMGRCWTLSAWLGRRQMPQQVARYGLVLMQLQVLAIYWQTVISKITNVNPYWRNGEFFPYFLMSHFARWPGPWAAEHSSLLAFGTYLALVLEMAIPVLLFVKRTRYWGMLLGFLLHGFISLMARNIEPFLLTMLMAYLAFLSGADVERIGRMFTGRKRSA